MTEFAQAALPPHPGSKLKLTLRPLNWTKSEIASLLRLSRQTLYDIMSGKQAVTPTVALRLGKLTGVPASSWLELQQARDLAVAKRADRKILEQIPALEEIW